MAKASLSTGEQVSQSLIRPATDPDTRSDGLCFTCEKERSAISKKHDDPFCSHYCCRVYYNLPSNRYVDEVNERKLQTAK